MSGNSSGNSSDAPTAEGVAARTQEPFLGQPGRPLDWRFARVQSLLTPPAGPRVTPVVPDDEYVQAMRQLLRRYVPSTPAARLRLAALFPGPCGALQLRQQAPPELQLAVQCRILARQTDAQIAGKTGQAPATIDWYEKCFFNVRENMHAPDWVATHVLRASCLENLSPQEGPLKRAAYWFGPDVFETLQTGFPTGADLSTAAGEPVKPEEFMEAAVQAGVRRRAMLAMLNVDGAFPKELIGLVRQMQAWAAAKLDAELVSDQERIAANALRHTMGQIQFLVRGHDDDAWMKKNNPELLKHDSYARELRDHEMFDVIRGNGENYAHYKDCKFPPPPSRKAQPRPDDFDPLEGS